MDDGSVLKPEEAGVKEAVSKNVPIGEAAKILGVKEADVQQLVKQELLKESSPGLFNTADLEAIATKQGLSLAEEATQVGLGLQRAIAATLNVVRVVVTTAFAGAVVYTLTVAGFVVAYSYYPNEVASWINQKNPSPLQALLQPEGTVALQILKYAQPSQYKVATQNIIVNPNDIFTIGKFGSLTPTGPLVIPQSSYLSILSKAVIPNLNAQYLQGRVPGTTVGNIAIEGQVTNLADNAVDTSAIQDSAVTNAKLSQITDANKVAGSAVQLSGSGGLTNNSGLSLLTTCSDSQILKWNSTNSTWECQADAGASGTGITSIREGGSTVVSSATAINFGASDFDVSESPATVGNITVDYANSKIVRSSQNETITGTWTFPSGTVLGTDTFTSNAITDSGALTIKTTTNGALTLDSGTVGAVNLGNGANSKTVTVGNTTGTSSLGLNAGSGGISLTGATTFNSTPITLAANSTVIDMTGTGTLSLNTVTNRAITTGTGLFTAGGALTSTGAFTADSSLTADGNLATPKGSDYATTGTQSNVNLGTGSFFRYTGVAAATFTGISGGTDGRLIRIANASSSNLTLNNLSGSSSAANQIVTSSGGDLVVGSGSAVNLAYDPTTAVWRVVSFTPSVSTLSTIAFVQNGNGFGTTAVLGTTDANNLNLITSGVAKFVLDSGASPTLTGQGSTTLTSTGTLTVGSGSGTGVTINSGGVGAILIGSDTDNETVQVAAGLGVKNSTFGSATGTSTTTILGGTSGIFIGDRNVTKQISIGGNIFDAADTIRVATNSTSADTLNMGNSNASTLFTLTGGNKWSMTSGGVLTVIGGAASDITTTAGNALTIDSGTTGALNFGTNSNAKTITIGNTTGGTTVNVNAGSGGGTFTSASGLALNPYGVSAGNTSELRFAELAANGSNYVGFKSPDSITANIIWTLPNADGGNGTVLTTNGTGGLTWSSSGACPTCFTNGGNSFAATADLGTNDANTLNLRTNTTTKVTILSGGNVGIGDTTPAALLTVGSGDKFQVDSNGNILAINNVPYSFPGSQGGASTVLTNDGAGGLTWAALGTTTTALSSVTAATGNATIGNANNNINWNWKLTGVTNGFNIGENVASTGTGYILNVSTLATSTAKPFSIAARGTTIFDTTAAGGLVLGDSATLNSPITIQSGTGAINIGTDAVAHTVTLGNITGATSVVLNAGTGNIDVGTTAQARALNFGTGAAAQTVTIGSTNGGSSLTLDSGTGAIGIGGTIAKTITIGNTTGATAVNINSGSGGINFGGATTITGSNTFTTGTGTSTFNSTLLNLAGASTVIDLSGGGTLGINTTNNAPITTGTGLFTTGGATTVDTTLSVIGNFVTPKGTDYATTGTQDNVDFGAGSLFRYTGVAGATFQGIANGANGRFIRIMNASSSSVILKNSSSGTAANNILTSTGADLTIGAGVSVGLQYDSSVGVTAWRVVVLPATSSTIGSFAYLQGGNAFGATATLGTTDANLLSLITGGTSRFQVDSTTSTLTGQNATTLTSTDTMSVTSAAGKALNVTSGTTGALTLDSGTSGDVNLVSSSTAKNINVGGTGANTIAIGNTQAAGSVTIGNAMVAGTITIGGTGQTGNITLGSSSGANNLFIANGAGATTLNLANNQTAGAVNIGAGMTSGTITIGGTGAQVGTITFGGGTGAQTVNLGTGGTGIKTVHIADGTAANIITIGTGQTGGSIALGSAMTTGTIDIGNSSGAMVGTINIGGSTGAQSLNFGGGNTGIKTIAIGGGTAANIITIGNNQTGGSFAVGNAMTNGTITLGGSSMTGTIALTTGTGVQQFTSGVVTGTTTTSAFVFNASALTSGTALRLTSSSASGLLFDQNATNTSGTIDKIAYGAAKTLTGATTGFNLDLSTNVTATGQSLTGISLALAGDTNIASATKTGLSITSGAITQNTGAATGTVLGADITMGALTLTSGTALNAHGIRITTGSITQTAGALTENGLLIDQSGSTITTGGTINGIKVNAAGVGAGSLNGINITGITAGAGTEYGINIGTGWDADINLQNATSVIRLGATDDTEVLKVVDSAATPNSILELRDLSANFGAAVTSGAFISRNSIFAEDFNMFHTNTTASTVLNRGDSNELTVSIVNVGAGGSGTAASQNTTNGVERLTPVSGNNTGRTGAVLETLGTTAAGVPNNIYASANLPVATMKMKVDTVGTNNRVFIGIGDATAAVTTMPVNGMFFSNCTASATCGTNWNAVVSVASVVTTASCGAVDTTHFAYGRIEVRSTTDVHFFMDTNTSNGITETECGTGFATSPSVAMTSMMEAASVSPGAATNTTNFDLDYFHTWQDDNATGIAISNIPDQTSFASDSTPSATIVPQILANDQISNLLGAVSATPNPDGSDNGLSHLVTDIQKETPNDPVTMIGKMITDQTQFLLNFIAARITAIRGYFDEVFANKVHTKEICVTKSDGSEVCVNGDELQSLLPTPAPTVAPSATPAATPQPNSESGTSTPAPTDTPQATPTSVPTESPAPTPVESPTPSP